MTPRVFITAFEPYGQWKENSSWLTLIEVTRRLRTQATVTTRLYPVDFQVVRQRLGEDLSENYDFAIHLGQSPGSGQIELESVGLNVGGQVDEPTLAYRELIEGGPVAYRSDLPLPRLVRELHKRGIPAGVSYHAGTYLCNAMLYLTHYYIQHKSLKTKATFVHLPLATSQVAKFSAERGTGRFASLPAELMGDAVQVILEELTQHAAGLPAPELA